MDNAAKLEICGFISITKQYEVECSECGIFDSKDTRDAANRAMAQHFKDVHGSPKGWIRGKRWSESWAIYVQ
jgi:hypothetical protein